MWENERKRETTKDTSRKHLLLVRRSLCIPSLENKTKKRKRLVCLLVDKPGATRISCFFVRIRKKTSSFVGSMSRIVARALSDSDLIRAAYCCVTLLSRLERIGMPRKRFHCHWWENWLIIGKTVFFCLVTARTNIWLGETRQSWLINQRRVASHYWRTNLGSDRWGFYPGRDVRCDTSGFQWLTPVLLHKLFNLDTLEIIETKDA